MRWALVLLMVASSVAGAQSAQVSPCTEWECVARCDAGDGRSCYRLGQYYDDWASGIARESACRLGYAPGCVLHVQNINELIGFLCKAGDTDACGEDLAIKSSSWEPPALKKRPAVGDIGACEDGFADKCITQAFNLEHGIGAPPDRNLAAALYTGACMQGTLDGCVQAARLSSPAVAAWLLRRACPSTGGPGCVALATIDPAVARRNLPATCDKDPYACFTLGGFLEREANREPLEPAATYAKGCSGGCGQSCRRLGELYRDGKLVVPDVSRATVFFSRACSLGDARSCSKSIQMRRP
jgi:TPR repeat protein